jgi:hypothetical protein
MASLEIPLNLQPFPQQLQALLILRLRGGMQDFVKALISKIIVLDGHTWPIGRACPEWNWNSLRSLVPYFVFCIKVQQLSADVLKGRSAHGVNSACTYCSGLLAICSCHTMCAQAIHASTL